MASAARLNAEFAKRDDSDKMSLTSDHMSRAAGPEKHRPADAHFVGPRSFRFLPKELIVKCRKLIASYHGMYGYVGLPDMLWLSDARDVIECHHELMQMFKRASKARGAKRANESFLLIATVIVAVEVLARDYVDWGKRFPAAKREAEKLLGDVSTRPRTWLMDLYLYPPLGTHRELSEELAAPATSAPGPARN
jgi:hypothetical protein